MIIDISTKIGTTSNQGGFKGLLDVYSGAAAAYSLRKLSKATTSVVRVRRDSDNAEADFTAQEITDGTLEAWVNTDVVRYESDFTSTENLFESNGTGAAAQSVAGVNDAYKFTLSGGSTTHLCGIFSLQAGVAFTVEFDYYIPSGQTVDAIRFRNLIANTDFNTLDSWTSVSISTTSSPANDAFWQPLASGSVTVDADGDVFYLKNIVVTQTTSDGLVTTWYDQSGNGNDATQGSAAAQPKIVSAGVLVTENGEPAVDFDGTDDYFFINYSTPTGGDFYFYTVLNFSSSVIGEYITGTNLIGKYSLFAEQNDIYFRDATGIQFSELNLTESWLQNKTYLLQVLNSAGTGGFVVNQDEYLGKALADNTNNSFILTYYGGHNTSNRFREGKTQEFVIYPTDQSTNRSGIEANINKGFNIYWDGTQKGLLDTYTGAEAAYSLRALNSAYTGAILRVRRASDNAEQDIYAKWDGTLNVEALETFCASTDGYVVTWYDQSGNANNATQATAASQPQIVSSGSIITDSGYQVIQYDGSDDNLGTSFTATGTMLMGGADGGAFYEVAISGAYNLLPDASLTDHPLKESIRVIWGRTLSAGEQSAIESRVTYSDWDFSDVADFYRYFRNRSELTSFPLIDTSIGISFIQTWQNCTSLTSFPALDVSNGTNFVFAWQNCSSLTSFPLLDVSSGTNFQAAWRFCSSLQDFPANMFDSVTATNFIDAFGNTNLTQTSVDNILVSIDTAGQSGGTFDQSGGSAPSAVGEAAIDNLRARGWTVTVEGGY